MWTKHYVHMDGDGGQPVPFYFNACLNISKWSLGGDTSVTVHEAPNAIKNAITPVSVSSNASAQSAPIEIVSIQTHTNIPITATSTVANNNIEVVCTESVPQPLKRKSRFARNDDTNETTDLNSTTANSSYLSQKRALLAMEGASRDDDAGKWLVR